MTQNTTIPAGVPLSILADYRTRFAACKPLAACVQELEGYIKTLCANRQRYQTVSAVTKVPWWVIGLIHGRECDFSFKQHLHNGDPLTARTRHEPAGRPPLGTPPFAWEVSAIDALAYDGLAAWRDWTMAGALYKQESYNGMGYRKRGVPSPYLWNMSNQAVPGKYVVDGEFDPKATDKQPGCATVLKLLSQRGEVNI